MQTFLPYPSFVASAKALDYRRLGKQRVEGYQILRTLLGISDGWANHPAVKMWEGYEAALYLYTQACIKEWVARGYRNTMILPHFAGINRPVLPAWVGDDRLHSSHRSNLLRKLPEHYNQFGWTDNPNAPYWWPTQEQ